jgi:hypothetical protein
MYIDDNKNLNELKSIKYTITLDPTTQEVKPKKDNKTIGIISNNLNTITEVTIDDFQKITSRPLSFTWFGGLFDGNLCNKNWQEQSVFAIDFDKGLISLDDAMKRLTDLHIYPQLWYETLGSSEILIKFRIVLFVDIPIKVLEHRYNIVFGLLKLFPEADQSCINESRFYFGGKESCVIHYKPISTQFLLNQMCICIITKDNGRVRNLHSLNKVNSCQLGEKQHLQYSMYSNDHISPTGTSYINQPQTTHLVGAYKIDFNLARYKIKILDEFLEGRWLYHNELFGLATNLLYVKGGMKLMKKTMEKFNINGTTNYTSNNFNIIKYLNNVYYHPQHISSFSPFEEDSDLYDLISEIKNIRGHIKLIKPIDKISLVEAENLFKEKFKQAIESENNKIKLFVLPTSLGKTEALTNINAVIAAPTNKLKNEISKRMKVDYLMTPDPIVFENESLNRKIDYYYRIGKPKNVIAILNDIIGGNASNCTETDIKKAKEYLSILKESKGSNKSILTTHSRALFSNFNNNTIVFDEDPLQSLIEIKKMDLTDLRKIEYSQGKMIEFTNVIELLESSAKGVINKTPIHNINVESMIENISMSSIESNIFDFFSSEYYVRDHYEPYIIHYVIKRKLPINKNIIILSATLPVFIYQKLFDDNLEIIDIKDVKQVGQIIQYTKRSCSRKSLSKYVNDISKLINNKPVLTFKSFGSKFKNPIKNMYFGNCSGYDTMKGKDIVVVGTPHRNNVEYLLIAKILGIEFKTTDTSMSYQKIQYNGFEFMFNCFEHDSLREIQLALIESDLIQAVGRSRTLREKAKVELYSNFPLRLSSEFIY